MKESDIEEAFCKEAAKRGLLSLKFGRDGWPDRIVTFPEGRVAWVELKAPGEKLRALQERRAAWLRRAGQEVYCIATLEEVRLFWAIH